jgi:hypothetical protein
MFCGKDEGGREIRLVSLGNKFPGSVGLKNARVLQGVLQNGLLDRRKDQTNIGGISGLGQAAKDC